MKQVSPTVLNIGPVRLSYLNVFEPRESKNEKGESRLKFDATLLIPKEAHKFCQNPKAEMKAILDSAKAAYEKKFGPAKGIYATAFTHKFEEAAASMYTAYYDGDHKYNKDGEPRSPGYWCVSASTDARNPPFLINAKQEEALPEHGWASGDWGLVQVNFSAWENSGKRGVSAYLNAIQFLHSDEHFGSTRNKAEVLSSFGTVEGADLGSTLDTVGGEEEGDPFADS